LPSPYISPDAPAAPAAREDFVLVGEAEAFEPVERFAALGRAAVEVRLDREVDRLEDLRAVEDFRDEDRAFEDDRDFDAVFFFEAPRDAGDFRPVFFARPELFDLPAALPAAFFFFLATECSFSSRAFAGGRIIQFQSCRIEKATAFSSLHFRQDCASRSGRSFAAGGSGGGWP
jgi:hypothetical protein